jgi:hypothetical protein
VRPIGVRRFSGLRSSASPEPPGALYRSFDHPLGVKMSNTVATTMAGAGKDVAMRQYKILRTWSVVLTVLGALTLVSTTIGVVLWAASVEGLWETAAVVAIGAPVALLLATWPVALGQALRALADIGDDMAFETLTTAASSP